MSEIDSIVAEYFRDESLTLDTWDSQGNYTERVQLSKDEFRAALLRVEGRWIRVDTSVEQLMKFYAVETYGDLIEAQAAHIEKLQAKVPSIRDEQPLNPRNG